MLTVNDDENETATTILQQLTIIYANDSSTSVFVVTVYNSNGHKAASASAPEKKIFDFDGFYSCLL